MNRKNFALIGAAGYIAPRHLKAIKDTGNNLVAAVDPKDSVGILDRYFFDTRFFQEFERFDRHAEKLRRKGDDEKIHFVSICSPNFLHDAHMRFALRIGADAICEKPLVINPWNIEPLLELQEEFGRKIYTVLQLRLHPSLIKMKERLEAESSSGKHEVSLTYVTGRGSWYLVSWKGQEERSGGLATNIGIHFFDLLIWYFGEVEHSEVHYRDEQTIAGYLELKHAKVKWFLSIQVENVPEALRQKGQTTFRSIEIDGEELEFSEGFTDLHTEVYKSILAGKGFGPEVTKPSINLVHDIRTAKLTGEAPHSHAFLKNKK